MVVLTLLMMEIIYQIRKPIKMSHRTMLANKRLPSMTMRDFEKAILHNQKYCLMDEYVIDIGKFVKEHPGGSAMINHHIGRSIGKYFYGAYSLEYTTFNHTHTYFAAKVLAKLAVAKIDSRENTVINHKEQLDYKLQDSSNIFTFKKKDKLMAKVYRVLFENNDVTVSNFTSDISNFGKSMLVTSMKNYTSRYYTICHCMWSGIYKEYITAMKLAVDGARFKRRYANVEKYLEESDSSIQFIMKHYSKSNDGVSHQVKTSSRNSEFYITGPIGRGVKLYSGLNIFISAGTGLLPFLDLFAYVARRTLQQMKGDYAIFADESLFSLPKDAHILVYCYYPTKNDAVGFDFCDSLSALCKYLRIQDTFTFVPKIKDQGDISRLKKQKIVKLIKKYMNRNISTLNVCGTPSISELFEANLEEISSESGLPSNRFNIL